MNIAKSLWAQFKALFPGWIVFYGVAMGLFGIVAVISWQTQIPFHTFTRDPIAATNAPLYTGVISTFGGLLWSAAASTLRR